ncbi:S-layer homology domain-containing protein [Cohnella panacarvi]|uniref:S-layer homology domain-containing protein n=1 Tax=Cohnella panacarvi TaxID=400776 RepID=UPI000479BC52|nr:S-layer homology domain-containing protein [Cohnella panacarvi]
MKIIQFITMLALLALLLASSAPFAGAATKAVHIPQNSSNNAEELAKQEEEKQSNDRYPDVEYIPVPAAVDTSNKAVSAWAKEDVDWMVINGIVPERLQFNYKSYIDREEFASLTVSVLDFMSKGRTRLIQTALDHHFEDTDSIDVTKAYSFGIVNGVSPTKFKPKNNISRQEAAMMMSNLLQSIQTANLSTEDYPYSDRKSIAQWALDAVDMTSNLKLFQGTTQGFKPQDNYTREQAIAVMRRLLQFHGSAGEVSLRGKVLVSLDALGTEEDAKSNKARPVSVVAGASNVRFTWTEMTPDSSRLLDRLVMDLSGHEGHHHEDTGVLSFTPEVVNSLKSGTGSVRIQTYTLNTGASKKADEGFILKVTW